MVRRGVLGMLVAVAVGTAAAEPTSEPTWKLDGHDSTYSYVCGGGDWIAINGKGNKLTITGECSLLEVNGSNNRISIESVETIKISGNNNDVRYTRAPDGKKKPRIKTKGAANTVRRDR